MIKKYHWIGLMLTIALLIGVVAAPGLISMVSAENLGGNTYERKVDYIKDGDSIRVQRPFFKGVDEIRALFIDAPETFVLDDKDPGNQIDPHAIAAREYLRQLLPRGTEVIVRTGEQELDGLDRLLGHVTRKSDGLDINLEMVRKGFNEHYFIGNPDSEIFEKYRAAQIEAMNNGLGIWSPDDPLQEHPFEYRLRMFENDTKRWVANYSTKEYVDPADYKLVPPEERIHFNTEQEAIDAGYSKKSN